ncbi:MAG TPA: hypothetical protein VKQ32_10500 [Polyangia bacterium]|nr:hypothetical protein [Polyangia bacterium]
MSKSNLRGAAKIGALLVVVVLAVVVWFCWTTLPGLPHALECRDIRNDYRTAVALVDRQRAETAFNAAGCTGSLLNTFLPAG